MAFGDHARQPHPRISHDPVEVSGRVSVGEHERARQLDEDTLTHRRRVLGDDHPDTLASANNLANDLRALGEHERARQLQNWIRAHRGS